MSKAILQTIYRYPVKGFPGERLDKANIKAGEGIPHDRRFAVTNGVKDTGGWMKARSFFINSVIDGMSKFSLAFDGTRIRLKNVEGKEISFEAGNAESLANANEQIADFMSPVGVQNNMPVPQIIERGNTNANWDYVDTPISIINAGSVHAVGAKLGQELDPLRFRGNFVIDGLPAWEEFSWMGKRIRIGEIELDVHRPIDRCPTPGVNPQTGERDVEVTPGLRDHFGHIYCGMYAKVVKSGEIKPGDEVEILGDGNIELEDTFVSNASAYPLWPRMAEVTASKTGKHATQITFKRMGPWRLPDAKPGQKLRLHLGDKGWTTEYLCNTEDETLTVNIEDSQTDDPMTQHMRKGLETGKQVVISGPFGRV